ncbi:MAG: SEFIR domain-containing protein [Pseudonocardiaceae bacterium]
MGGDDTVRVFISYAHDDAEHEDRVRRFWLFLRANGIDAVLDKPAAERRQDWSQWMLDQVHQARFVLVVASPAYREHAEGQAPPDEGRGERWEAALIRQEVYADREAALERFLPVVLPGSASADIPIWLDRDALRGARLHGGGRASGAGRWWRRSGC